ncbi:MAG TPA: cupin domain-containing protein [Xanthobacteraceae bacterium]
MCFRYGFRCVLAVIALSAPASAQDHGLARPDLILEQTVDGMPRDESQSVRVLTAAFKPGDATVRHTHRFPVTVYVLEGAFTLELKGRAPIAVNAGEAIVEPPNVEMVGYNRSATDVTKVVIVYVSTPNTPFLDPLH